MFVIFRQLYLLLWKNYVLRKRKKIRVVVEFLWPLFLFLVLMWVRTRGLKANEPQCNFVERPLPSGGILPFLRTYICELNNSCSATPRPTFYDQTLLEVTQLSFDGMQFINKPGTSSSLNVIFNYVNEVRDQRQQAGQITGNLTLEESLSVSADEFNVDLAYMSLSQSTLNSILQSHPNYNYLYSNYSRTYSEPTITNFFLSSSTPAQTFINFLYGPDLDSLDLNRANNQVGNANWLRSKLSCSSANGTGTNSLLRSMSAATNAALCSLADSYLSSLFIYISENIDFSHVKQTVHDETKLSSSAFLADGLEALESFNSLKQSLQESGLLSKYNLSTFGDLYTKLASFNSSQLCAGSKLSLFDIIASLSMSQFDASSLQEFLSTAYTKMSSPRSLMSIGRLSSMIASNLDSAWRNKNDKNGRKRPATSKLEVKSSPFEDRPGSDRQQRLLSGARASSSSSSDADIEFTIELISSFNNLNLFNTSDCPALQIIGELDTYTQSLINSTGSKTCFCQTIYALINSLSQDTQVLFNQIKPMFLGKILYGPNTPAYKKLIKRMNSTFESIDRLTILVGQTGQTIDNIVKRLNLSSPDVQNQIEQSLTLMGIDLSSQDLTVKRIVLQLRLVAQIMKLVQNSLQCMDLNKFVGYSNENTTVQAGLSLIEKQTFWAAIVFNNEEKQAGVLPNIVSYKIRMNASLTHDTTYTQDRIYNFGPSNCLGCNAYYLYGFIYIQDLLEKAIVEEKTNTTRNFGIVTQMTPYPCYVNDKFISAIARTLPLFMVLAWIYTVSMMVKDIVYEKEKRLKEFMRVMGLSNGIHWLSWFITQFTIMFCVTFVLCLVIKFGKVTTYSDFFVLLVFFICFTMATISQCFLISVFFNKANLAAVTGGIIYFLLYLPYTILINYAEVIKPWQKGLASLSSTVAFSYGCEIISSFELETIGVQWSNFYSSPFVSTNEFSMNTVCLILLLDAAIYMILTWYIEGIAPGEYGVPRKWYFPLQPSYWFGDSKCFKSTTSKTKNSSSIGRFFNGFWLDYKEKTIREEEAREEELKQKEPGKFHFANESLEKPVDAEQLESRVGIRIEKLHKVYSRGNNHALKGLTVNFYENEISAFLGHNGAGKSTTMHLLTGLYKPTSGTAKINGHDISNSMDGIRKSLGFVPQHNVLFPGMTVREHLWFYARLKGLATDLTKKEIDKMLEDTGLVDKKNELSKNLSGGMQRKLSVAIAFVGGSKTVILDEPSAGVDPSGRRSIWDLLFKYRIGRTIVISTHHMDEADVLGDRIAIISNGKLIAHGTSYFLKNKFGRGYYLTIAKKPLDNEYDVANPAAVSPSSSSTSSDDSSLSRDSGARSLSSLSEEIPSKASKSSTPPSSQQLSGPHFRPSPDSSFTEDDQDEEIDMEDFEKAQLKNEQTLLAALSTSQDIQINAFIKSKIPSALLVENIGTEMTYSISNKPEHTRNYEKIFDSLEKAMPRLAIDSIGLSDTTLEEIFIKLAKQPKANSFQGRSWKLCGVDFGSIKKKICCWSSETKKTTKLTSEQAQKYAEYTSLRVGNNFRLVTQQLYALMLKRFHRVKRNIKGFFAEIVLPVLFVCLALLVATLTPAVSNRPALELHPWYYGQPNQMFLSRSSSLVYDRPIYDTNNGGPTEVVKSSEQSNIDEINRIKSTFLSSTGPGTRCMNNYKIVVTQQVQDYTRAGGPVTLSCLEGSAKMAAQLVHGMIEPPPDVYQQLQSTNFSYSKVSPDCDCSSGFPDCPVGAGGDYNYRSVYQLKSTDMFYDLTSRNLTDWFIKTEFDGQFFKKRFGGYEFIPPLVSVDNEFAANFFQTLNDFSSTFNSFVDQLAVNTSSTLKEDVATKAASSTPDPIFTSSSDPLISNENVKIWYNTKGYDSSVSYLNVMNNAIMRAKFDYLNELLANATEQNQTLNNYTYTNPADHGIVAFNHPMPFTTQQYLAQSETAILLNLFVAICIIFALSFIPASFLVFLLEERENNSKQLQFVSGVKPYIYWVSNFVWDLFNYIVPCILCILIFVIFNVQAYMSRENFPCMVCLMLLYGWACIPLMYPLNYVFKVPSTAFVVSSSFNVFCGVVTTMTTSVLDQLGEDEPDLLHVNNILKPVFLIVFPHYCLGQGFLQMATLYTVASVKRSYGYTVSYDPFEFNSVGQNLLALACQGVFYFSLNLLIQYEFFIRFKPTSDVSKLKLDDNEEEDEDVKNERMRVLRNEQIAKAIGGGSHSKNRFNNVLHHRHKNTTESKAQIQPNGEKKDLEDSGSVTDYIRLVNLTKIYKKFSKFRFKRHVAVNNLCLGINKGECFGLIGVNGAGKTTTFKMLTGELPITGGDVYVNGASVSKQIERVHQNIGYCPQTDAIMPLLTAREHLIFFARLRGVPEKYVNEVSEWAMHRVGLSVFADRISGDFSGGNKRKLSTAIALVGNPSVICLDEPTSGMDAKARRLLWNDIISLVKENRIVILTSHSMEECEALCTRLVIMVNGKFKCLGSPQHLKAKFGSGYKLAIRLDDERGGERSALFAFMKRSFPTSLIQESHKNLFEYILPFNDTKLSEMFGKLEQARESLHIKDYSVSQTTLDQVFINFAKLQTEDPYDESQLATSQVPNDIYKLVAMSNKKTDAPKRPNEQPQMSLDTREITEKIKEIDISLRRPSNKSMSIGDQNALEATNQYYFDANNNLAAKSNGETSSKASSNKSVTPPPSYGEAKNSSSYLNAAANDDEFAYNILPRGENNSNGKRPSIGEQSSNWTKNSDRSVYEISYL